MDWNSRPRPRVYRKGIAYLEQHRIIVHMYDHDLQSIIYRENQEFIDQVKQRAKDVEQKSVKDESQGSLKSDLKEDIRKSIAGERPYLIELFKRVNGDVFGAANYLEVGTALSLTKNQTELLTQRLEGLHILEFKYLGGGIGFTRQGIKVAEKLFLEEG